MIGDSHHVRRVRGYEFEDIVRWDLLIRLMQYRKDLSVDDCNCYQCVGSITRYTDDGHEYVWNNMMHHTLGEPCETCGRPKGEYRDRGTKGYYECHICDSPD